MARSQARELLTVALRDKRITPKEYRALLDHVSGSRPSEAAATEGITPNAWWDRIRRVRTKLRDVAGLART